MFALPLAINVLPLLVFQPDGKSIDLTVAEYGNCGRIWTAAMQQCVKGLLNDLVFVCLMFV
jgi:hypothetical protein